MSTFERIVELKERLYKTDADFERAAHLSPKLFDKWMRGSRSFNKYLADIANALNTTTDYLLGKTDNPAKKEPAQEELTPQRQKALQEVSTLIDALPEEKLDAAVDLLRTLVGAVGGKPPQVAP